MATDLRKILKLSVPVIVIVGDCRLSVDDVLALGPGAILELDRPSEAQQDILINNKVIGRGVTVKVAENFGIRFTEIGTPEDRIAAMRG